jgi:hypothetical protein
MDTAEWLARVGHDLVKRLLWPARDRRDLGGAVVPGELVVRLVDDDGAPTTAAAVWQGLATEAPASRLLADFERALVRAIEAAARDDLEGVLALEVAYQQLARNVKGSA